MNFPSPLSHLFAGIVCVTLGLTLCGAAQPAHPVKIIYDTDMDLDVDDAGALAMLHALADNGEAEILGVVCNAPTPYGATTIAAINRYYGHPEIPVGDLPPQDYLYDEAFNGLYRKYALETPYGDYNRPIFRRFDHGIRSRADVWDGVKLYRKLLADAPDASVTIAAVGLLTVLEDLLQSGPDEYSALGGKELVRRKVDKLVCMGGSSTSRVGKPDFNWGFDGRGDAERVNAHWPTPIVISTEGRKVQTGQRLLTETPADNPVRVAYELFLSHKPLKNRSSWDQIAVLYAVRGAGKLWSEARGQRLEMTVAPFQYKWRPAQPGEIPHVLLQQTATHEQLKTIIEDLMVQAPQSALTVTREP